MSDLHATGLIGALLVAATFLIFHVSMTANRIDAEIITGVVGGVPVPRKFRWWTLLNIEIPLSFFAGCFAVLVAFVFLRIGDGVENADVAWLAQACAVFYFSLSALWLVTGATAIGGVISGRFKRAIYRSPSH